MKEAADCAARPWTQADRRNAFISRMEQAGMDFLVIYFNGIHTFLTSNFVHLLTGFKSLGDSLYVLGSDGSDELYVSPEWDHERARNTGRVACVRAAEHVLEAFLERWGPRLSRSGERVGFIGSGDMPVSGFHRLMELMGGSLREADATFTDLAAIKTAEEIELARKATWIAERGFEKMLEVARPGMYDYELAGELVSYMKSLGADDNFLLMSASRHNQAVRPPGKRRLERGDVILAEISPSCQGQFTQICRTIMLGDDHSRLFHEKYELLIQAMESGFRAAKPGARMSDVFHAINRPLLEAGYESYCAPPYMRVRGHGLGLGSILPGDISAQNDLVLEEGMLFVIHPNQYIPETGYMLCGEPALVTANGAVRLSSRAPALSVV